MAERGERRRFAVGVQPGDGDPLPVQASAHGRLAELTELELDWGALE